MDFWILICVLVLPPVTFVMSLYCLLHIRALRRIKEKLNVFYRSGKDDFYER